MATLEPQQEDEDRESQPLVRDDGIDPVGDGATGLLFLIFLVSLRQGALDEGVLGIDNGRFGRGLEEGSDALGLFRPGRRKRLMVRKFRNERLDVAVALQVFDGQVAGGIPVADVLVREDQVAEADDALLDFLSVVDVDMTGDLRN